MARELPDELFLGRNDGMQISVELSVILPTNRDGHVLGAVAIVRDVTPRWEQEQAPLKGCDIATTPTDNYIARSL